MKQVHILLAMSLLAHTGFSQAKLTRLQKRVLGENLIGTKSESDKIVAITVNTDGKPEVISEVTRPQKRNVFDLSPTGQKAFIDAVASKSQNLGNFLESVPKSLVIPNKERQTEIRSTAFVKKIEVDVRDMLNGSTRSGRIAELLLSVKLENNQVLRLVGFKNVVTKYEMIDFGSISLTRNRNFSLNAGLNIMGTGSTSTTGTSGTSQKRVSGDDTDETSSSLESVGSGGTTNTSNLGVSLGASRTVAENVDVKLRRITMKGSIGSTEALIYQEGYPAINLNDKITLELLIESVQNDSELLIQFNGLYEKDGKAVTADTDLTLDHAYLTTPQSNPDVSITVAYEYVYREVENESGKNSPGEWDDKVRFHKLNDRTIVATKVSTPFVAKDELNVDRWVIVKPRQGGGDDYLAIDYFGKKVQLKFLSLKDASDLLYWLKMTDLVSFKGHAFAIGQPGHESNLTVADIGLLTTKHQ